MLQPFLESSADTCPVRSCRTPQARIRRTKPRYGMQDADIIPSILGRHNNSFPDRARRGPSSGPDDGRSKTREQPRAQPGDQLNAGATSGDGAPREQPFISTHERDGRESNKAGPHNDLMLQRALHGPYSPIDAVFASNKARYDSLFGDDDPKCIVRTCRRCTQKFDVYLPTRGQQVTP